MFGLLKLKTCSLYHENLILQKFNDMYNQVLWYECYLTTIPVVVGVSDKSVILKLKTCSLYHENLFLQKFNDMDTQVLT